MGPCTVSFSGFQNSRLLLTDGSSSVCPPLGPWLWLLLPGITLRAFGPESCCTALSSLSRGTAVIVSLAVGSEILGQRTQAPETAALESRDQVCFPCSPQGLAQYLAQTRQSPLPLPLSSRDPSLSTAARAGVGPKTQAERPGSWGF